MDAALLKQALLGTDKSTPIPATVGPGRIDSVEALDADIATDSVPWRLLLKAGCYAVAERAGFEPAADLNRVSEIAPGDSRPMLPAAPSELLLVFFKEHSDQPHIPLYFLGRVDRAGFRLRPESLPEFLSIFSMRRDFMEGGRALVVSVLGERGRWLAGKNPSWNWVAGKENETGRTGPDGDKETHDVDRELEETWGEGTFSERKSILDAIASRSPETAVRLLRETWTKDKAEYREAFLDILAPFLGEADVAFLESVLSDRSKNVRKIAAIRLARMPESPFAQRVLRRAETVLVPGKKKGTLQIVPPASFTKDMRGELIDEKPPRGVGEKASWTADILAYVPLAHWEKRFDMSPARLLAAIADDDYYSSVLFAWTHVARSLPGHGHWLEPLWDAWESVTEKSFPEPFYRNDELVKHCLQSEPEKFLRKLKARKGKKPAHDLDAAWFDLALKTPVPWSKSFAESAVEHLHNAGDPLRFITAFAPFFPAETIPRVRDFLEQLVRRFKYYSRQVDKRIEMIDRYAKFERLLDAEREKPGGEGCQPKPAPAGCVNPCQSGSDLPLVAGIVTQIHDH